MEPFTTVIATTAVIHEENVDTDQIIPASFLTTTERDGLGAHAFHGWRYDAEGRPTDSVFNQPATKAAQILVAGRNFGCGSSREHAPWALTDYGFRVVISTEIADIFKGNSLKNGLLPIEVEEATHRWLLDNPGAEISVDLESQIIQLPDQRRIAFTVDAFARYCLMNGTDELGFLLDNAAAITAFEATRG